MEEIVSCMVAVCNRNQSDNMRKVKQLVGNRCEISEESFFDVTKGLVFVQNYNITDLTSFTERINDQCGVKELVEEKWAKARSETTQVFIITFKSDKLPGYIRIPGEADRTTVYEFKDMPMSCKKCNRYGGHTEKRCLISV